MRRLVCGLVLSFTLAAGVPAPAADDAQEPVALPGGVTDAAGKVGYCIAKVNLENGKMETLPGADRKEMKGPPFVEVAKLPKEVQEVAKRENWQVGVVIGPRAYGKVQKAQGKPGGFGGVQNF